MNKRVSPLPHDADSDVDSTIFECLNPHTPRSFFLYAGAGSGKTYSLVLALNNIRKTFGEQLRVDGKKIAVITFTNAASDEISGRIDQDPLFMIKTIHSFCWQIIKPLQTDIQHWLLSELPKEILELQQAEERGRAGTAASIARLRSISNKQNELAWLSKPRTFRYNPSGDNTGRGALSHADVIKIASEFLEEKASVQQILVNQYPIIFIDESQDTNKNLMTSLLAVEQAKRGKFALGLFGDMMQRIYSDGLSTLAPPANSGWATPQKRLNRRSPRRVVELGNAIRAGIDGIAQHPMEGAVDGVIRLFIADADRADKPSFENSVRSQMAAITGDDAWSDTSNVKQLMLEHSMAAERMGFAPMFNALRKDKRRSTSLMEGTLPAISFFSKSVVPLWELWRSGRKFQLMSHITAVKSPLLEKATMNSFSGTGSPLQQVNKAINESCEFLDKNPNVTFGDVLNVFANAKLFTVPASLAAFVNIDPAEVNDENTNPEEEEDDDQISAISSFLESPFSQIVAFTDYISGRASFDTHQGVKGLEFDRVQVVMDDAAAGGFLFSYERLFNVKPLSDRERTNMAEGKETSIQRTSRLLYVTCTRAKRSLAVVAYTENKNELADFAKHQGWFSEDEIVIT